MGSGGSDSQYVCTHAANNQHPTILRDLASIRLAHLSTLDLRFNKIESMEAVTASCMPALSHLHISTRLLPRLQLPLQDASDAQVQLATPMALNL